MSNGKGMALLHNVYESQDMRRRIAMAPALRPVAIHIYTWPGVTHRDSMRCLQ